MAKMKWKSQSEVEKEKELQERISKHTQKKEQAQKLIMDKITSEYILNDDLSDEERDLFTNMFDLWEPEVNYSVGDKVLYNELVFEVIQAHTSQSDWLPSDLPALYKIFYQTSTDDGAIVVPDWVQPTGSHDAYSIGDTVRFEGVIFESTMDNNTWSPSEYAEAWKRIEVS